MTTHLSVPFLSVYKSTLPTASPLSSIQDGRQLGDLHSTLAATLDFERVQQHVSPNQG